MWKDSVEMRDDGRCVLYSYNTCVFVWLQSKVAEDGRTTTNSTARITVCSYLIYIHRVLISFHILSGLCVSAELSYVIKSDINLCNTWYYISIISTAMLSVCSRWICIMYWSWISYYFVIFDFIFITSVISFCWLIYVFVFKKVAQKRVYEVSKKIGRGKPWIKDQSVRFCGWSAFWFRSRNIISSSPFAICKIE